jgi:hypothetical protein
VTARAPRGGTPSDLSLDAAAALTAEEFEGRYRELLRAFESGAENDQCVQCDACRGCTQCTFCRSSRNLIRCHYCVDCVQCTDSSHCQASSGLLSCQHCTDTRSSSRSSYLIRCASMTHCTYCFGCVGLSHKDFHILNQPYDRSTYFAVTRALLQKLTP